jgi:hypothetical protein
MRLRNSEGRHVGTKGFQCLVVCVCFTFFATSRSHSSPSAVRREPRPEADDVALRKPPFRKPAPRA